MNLEELFKIVKWGVVFLIVKMSDAMHAIIIETSLMNCDSSPRMDSPEFRRRRYFALSLNIIHCS